MLVSIIIPTFNRAATIGRAVESALSQTYHPTEIIVVDDGSTDQTPEALRQFGDAIRVVKQVNAGPSAARNRGVAHARGEIIAFLDSDDDWLPEKLERQLRLMRDQRLPCCICNASLTADGREFATSFGLAGLKTEISDGVLTNPGAILATRFVLFNQVVAVRRDTFQRIGGFRPELRILEDYDLAFRLALEGPWGIVSAPLVRKYEDTLGIGVLANRNPVQRAQGWKLVLGGFLALPVSPDVQRLVARSHRDVLEEVRALELLSGRSLPLKWLGRTRLARLNAIKALRRRMPGWPQPQIHESAAEPTLLAGTFSS